jgi:hypothetical protein
LALPSAGCGYVTKGKTKDYNRKGDIEIYHNEYNNISGHWLDLSGTGSLGNFYDDNTYLSFKDKLILIK